MSRSSLSWKLLPVVRVGFSMFGRRWVDFYGWMLNRQERNNSIEKILSANRGAPGDDRGLYDLTRCDYHLAYMKRHGLKADHRVLDFGCGFGRSTIPLLKFLDGGYYTGVEISAERVRIANEWLAREGLQDRPHKFVVSGDLQLSYVDDESVDFFWAQAVISHMPEADIRVVLQALKRVMSESGIVLFDYVESPDDFEQHSVKDFFYTRDQMERMIRETGWDFERCEDWNDDLASENRDSRAIVVRLVR